VPTQLAPLVVVRAAIEDVRARPGARGDLHRRDLQVVRCLAGRVRAQQQAVRRVGLVWGAGSISRTVGDVGEMGSARARDKWRTILCRETIGRLSSASRGHALSLDRTDMGRSSSCRNMYMKPLTRPMVCLPYLVLLQGNSTTAWPLYFTLDTHLVDKLVLLLGVFKFIFRNGRLHGAQKGTRVIESRRKSKGHATRSGARGK
jgi:hypothetical protein